MKSMAHWNFVPQFFYDMIGRFCPGAIVMLTTLIVIYGPGDIDRNLLHKIADKAQRFPIYTYVGIALASYFIADILDIVYRQATSRSSEKAMDSAALIAQWKRLHEYDLTDPKTPAGFIMLDYLRIHMPSEATRLLKLRAEARFSEVITVGYILLAIVNNVLLLSCPIKQERVWLELGLLVCAGLSHWRAKTLHHKRKNGITVAWLNCVYGKVNKNIRLPLRTQAWPF